MSTQSIQIKAPIQTVYQVITDFENYPRFLNEMKSSKVVWCDDSKMEVQFHLFLIKEIKCTLLFELDPPHEIHWSLKHGEMMKTNDGFWALKELSDNLTEAKYGIDVTLGLWVPKAITETLIEKDLPKTLRAFKKESERRFKTAQSE